MTPLGPHAPAKRFRVNWNAAGVVAAIALALLSWYRDAARDFSKDFEAIRQRVAIIETLRTEDSKRLERIEDKLDHLAAVKQ